MTNNPNLKPKHVLSIGFLCFLGPSLAALGLFGLLGLCSQRPLQAESSGKDACFQTKTRRPCAGNIGNLAQTNSQREFAERKSLAERSCTLAKRACADPLAEKHRETCISCANKLVQRNQPRVAQGCAKGAFL